MKISVLDLCMVSSGSTVPQALKSAVELARHLETLGFPRIWYAEHHNMTGIASAATSVLIGQVAAATSRITVGAGGVMLPNHAPLVIAEQFGTLEALYPGRIELGLGRAPGTDPLTSRALRRTPDRNPDAFPQDVVELLGYFRPAREGQPVQAVPGAGQNVPVWILGSGLFGARLAAVLGLPYAFASHFAPAELIRALAVYRERFQPSEYLEQPRAMVAANVVVAQSDEEARMLFSSLQQAFVSLRAGHPGPLPPPVENYAENLPARHRMILDQALSCSVAGAPGTVLEGLKALIDRTQADELIITTPLHDPGRRHESFTMLADVACRL